MGIIKEQFLISLEREEDRKLLDYIRQNAEPLSEEEFIMQMLYTAYEANTLNYEDGDRRYYLQIVADSEENGHWSFISRDAALEMAEKIAEDPWQWKLATFTDEEFLRYEPYVSVKEEIYDAKEEIWKFYGPVVDIEIECSMFGRKRGDSDDR